MDIFESSGLLPVAPFIDFVLVRPQFSGNAGSAARALKNTGFNRLVLVQPGFQKGEEEMLKFAVGARSLVEEAPVFENLSDALLEHHLVLGTSRRRGGYRKNFVDLFDLPAFVAQKAAGLKTAILFGTEANGLSNEELDHCQYLVSIPAQDDFESYNLSQAVLLVAFEWLRQAEKNKALEPVLPFADHKSLEGFYAHFFGMLETIGFLRKSTPHHMPRILRNIFNRAQLTDSEVRVLRGICRQILWYQKTMTTKT